MVKINFFVFIASLQLLLISVSLSQEQFSLENWKTYSSLLDVKSADIDSEGRIWAGTQGGAFYYNPKTEEFREFRNIDALMSLDITVVKANPQKKEIYFGTFDGILDIITEDLKWTHITDILKPKFPNPVINDIIFNNNLAYIGGGFGLTVFDVNEKVFLETPPRLGKFQPNTKVNKLLVFKNELWAATESGIAKINLNLPIINPESWLNYTEANGLPGSVIKGLTVYKDEIYCYSDTTIYKFQGDTFHFVYSIPVWDRIGSIGVFNGKLCISNSFSVWNITDNKPVYIFYEAPDSAQVTGYITDKWEAEEKVVIMLKDNGFIIKDKAIKQVKPVSPLSNLFTSLAVDESGALWSATESNGKGRGFMKLENNKWENFSKKSHPVILTDDYDRVSSLNDGRVILSSWGSGMQIWEKGGKNDTFKHYDHYNCSYTGSSETAINYIVVGETGFDTRTNTIWSTNYSDAYSGNILVAIDKNNTCYSFFYQAPRTCKSLAIDYSWTKWAGSENSGLFWFNENGTLDDQSDDKSGSFTSELPNTSVKCLAVDKEGVVWVGTSGGLAYVLIPSAVLRNGNPILKPTSVKILQSQPINDIMVDALNNKWIATNQGVWVLDPDGVIELAQINTKNSPIITDEIAALATNEKTGQIYIGTRKGLTEVTSFSIRPLESFDIRSYPQPYDPKTDGSLVIEGLASNSDVRILTVDGVLVKSLTTAGRKVLWDGTNTNGDLVSSGIYLIAGNSLTSDATGIAKFVVVRK